MVAPERADRLVFAAFTYKGEGSPTLTKRAEQVDYYRSHNMRKRDRDMIRSIATRDKPGTSDPAAVEALADAEMQFGDQVPTGTYLDMTANLPVVHPEKVLSPVLLVRGEYDGIATVADLEEFFNMLPNGDRQFIILPGTAHSVDARDQPAIVLARDAGISHHAGADRDVTSGRHSGRCEASNPESRDSGFASSTRPGMTLKNSSSPCRTPSLPFVLRASPTKKEPVMAKLIFVNLPVADLARATAFYQAIGAAKNEQFCDDTASCMVFSETIHAMLLTHDKFRQFTPKKIADAKTSSEVLICISADSRDGVDDIVGKAKAAGGAADPSPKQDYGFMYGRSFEDPDGHIWEVMWMDVEAAAKAQSATADA